MALALSRQRTWCPEDLLYLMLTPFSSEDIGRVFDARILTRGRSLVLLGADALAAHVRGRLGVDWHETTDDGAVTLQPVFCLGLCAVGPSAMLDGAPLARLDDVRIDAALDRAR